MRRFYVRRKDFSHFPFQIYITREGVESPLEKGVTYTFAFEPPKEQYSFLHIHILQDFAQQVEERWGIPETGLICIAARALEAWLQNQPIPEDHFNARDMLRVDAQWYPHDRDLAPLLMPNPYRFEVETDEPWPTDVGLQFPVVKREESTPEQVAHDRDARKIVFGFTLDVFPGLLIVGYEQVKRKVAEEGLGVQVMMARLNDLPPNVHTLFVPLELEQAARQAAPDARVVALDDLVSHPMYDALIQELKDQVRQERVVSA